MKILIIASFTDSLINFRGFLLKEFVEKGHDVYACAPEASIEQVQTLESFGVKFHQVYLSRTGLNPFSDYKTYKAIKSLCIDIAPDCVLSYTIKPVMYGSLAASSAGVANIYSMITGLGYIFTGETLCCLAFPVSQIAHK